MAYKKSVEGESLFNASIGCHDIVINQLRVVFFIFPITQRYSQYRSEKGTLYTGAHLSAYLVLWVIRIGVLTTLRPSLML